MEKTSAARPDRPDRPDTASARLRRAPLLVVLLAGLAVLIGACSSSGSSSSDAPAAQAGASSGTQQAGVAQFAQCMRQNGVTNFPDPQNGHFVMGGGIQSNPHFQSAIQACQHLLGPGGIGGNNSGNSSAELAFAHCMQTHGVPSFPDPRSDGAIVAPPENVRSTAAYQNAYQECKSKLPNGGAGLQG
jgi:hypothetical protein